MLRAFSEIIFQKVFLRVFPLKLPLSFFQQQKSSNPNEEVAGSNPNAASNAINAAGETANQHGKGNPTYDENINEENGNVNKNGLTTEQPENGFR